MVRATTSFLRDFALLADIDTPHNVSLPDSVERLIARICTEKSVLPPDYLARQALDRLGESVSLNILGVIASSRGRVRNFSGFIMHLATNSPIAMAHNAEGPPVGVGDDSDKSSDDWEMVDREPIPSDQEMTTRGRIENLFPTVIGNHEMPIPSDQEMTTQGRTENLFPTVVGNDEMSILSDQEVTTRGRIENLFPTVTGNYEMLILSYQEMTTRGRIENLFPTVMGNYEMPILSDQEMTTLGRIENLSPTVVGNDKMVHRRLEKEMDQLRLQDYANYCHSSIPQSTGPSCQRVLSPQMKALGNFEFRRAFLILSYLGRAKLEETVSMGLLRDLTCMPMEAFEFHIWKEFGIKNIKPSDRRKTLDWDMGKTHVYHCHVDLQGEVTFKGPFLESTKTHLQRVLGDENILQVKFEEVRQEKKNHFDFDNYYCDVYHRVAEQGIELGLRQYQFLMYKDGGREENKRSGTRSSANCYFVCTSSGWVRDRNNDFHYGKTVNEIRLSFMHIHTVPSLAKYISRLSLILSKTIKLNIDLSDPELRVETIPDIHCKDGSTVLKGIHTDGTGFISEDLALQCPIYVSKGKIQAGRDGPSPNNDGPPLLMQVQLFYNGLCAKGTLLVNRLLPKKTIQIRPSMIKVAPDPSMWDIVPPFNSLEVVNTSIRPKKVHLSRYLISLLHFGGVPAEFFLGLLSTALQETECWHYDRGAALKVALNNEGMDSDHLTARMIMSGMPLDEPFLQYRLGLMLLEERKDLKAGKIPISDSYYLMGTTDPTGQLCANQVCIILGEGQLSGDVLVYKHPGLHPGDIRLLQATFVEGLERVVGDSKYAIFFPSVGPRSLADEMANSDFDGDIYWVSRHPELLKYFKPSPPWLALEEDSSKKGADNISLANMNGPALETLLFHSFLNNRFKPSYTVGLAAECWLVYMDRLLTPGVEKGDAWPNIEKLINIYYDALDAPKTGKKVEVGKALKVVRYPHFMEKKVGEDFEYHSSSILGLIYDKVQSFKSERLQLTKFVMLPCLSVEVPKNCMDKWGVLYDKYSKEMMEALGIEEKDMKYKRCQEIIDCYKKILYGAWEFKERTRPEDQIQNEALAIYQIVYEKAQIAGKVEKCWFAWRVAGPVLCKYYVSSQDDDDVSHVSINVLQKLYELKI